MSGQASSDTTVETFFASPNSPLAKNRRYIWFVLVLGTAPIIYWQVMRDGAFRFTPALLLLPVIIGLLVEWLFRRQLRLGQPLVTLTDASIEAPNLSGPAKRLAWRDIERISLTAVQGSRILTFGLRSSSAAAGNRGFRIGLRARDPALSLLPFTGDVQEQLLDAINRRHTNAVGVRAESSFTATNEIREEREFQERMREMQPHTWVTYGLIAINVLVWMAGLTHGAGFAGTPADKLFAWGGNAASEVQRGEWWRMLSATFLHGSLVHVAANMIGLYMAGTIVERIYGARLYLIVYFGSALMGSALSLHFSAQQAVSVGASGAVFGVTGALLVAVFQHRDKLPKAFSSQTLSGIGFFVVYSLIQGFGKAGIDNAAHVGGLVGGCLAALILPERFDLSHFQRTFGKRAATAVLVLGVATLSVAAMAPQATLDQRQLFASPEIVGRALKRFDEGLKALQKEQADILAGRMSELEADVRSRTVFAPVFREVAADLSRVVVRPGDSREPFLRDVRRMAELFAEGMAMESVRNETTRKLDPADPIRSAQIHSELATVGDRVKKFIDSASNKNQR